MPPLSVSTIDLLHQDAELLVVSKPGGLLSVPGRGEDKQDCLASRVVSRVPDALVVHRLDMSTSGVMVFARGKHAQRRLSAAFAERRVDKCYVAVVEGLVAAEEGEIDLPLLTDWPNRPLQKIDHELGKPALTRYRVLQRNLQAGTTRVALEPVTGRTHQLRVHLLALGHPIVGDALYAPDRVRGPDDRLMLHAESLCLAHPSTGELLRFHRPAPF